MKFDALPPPVGSHWQKKQVERADLHKRDFKSIVVRIALLIACLLSVWSVINGWIWSLGRVTTTGCEEEALFAIWKFTNGETVYAATNEIPFSVSYFNWLFFFVYGGIAKITFVLFSLESSALPTISRAVTLGFAISSIGILYAILGMLNSARLAGSRVFQLACSIFLVVNPLTGAWLITARPDMAAITCELAGLLFALRYADTRKMGSLLGATIAAYAAWSFKHNYVHLLGGLFLFLALGRRWRELGLVALIIFGLVGGSLLAGGTEYRHALIGAQINCRVSAAAAWAFFQKATGSSPQLVAIAVGLVLAVAFRKRWPTSGRLALLAAIGSIALAIGFLGASKQGADTQYFIPASIFGVIWGLCLFHARDESSADGERVAHIVHWAVLATFCLGILIGLAPHFAKAALEVAGAFTTLPGTGQNKAVSSINPVIDQLKHRLNDLPAPIFVTDRACNLPWIQTKAPHFVYSFTYALDRNTGAQFEKGGIGGLIESGYFETVVVLERNCACESPAFQPAQCSHVTMNHLPLVKYGDVPSIDGGRMVHYQFAFTDGVFAYYRKRKP